VIKQCFILDEYGHDFQGTSDEPMEFGQSPVNFLFFVTIAEYAGETNGNGFEANRRLSPN